MSPNTDQGEKEREKKMLFLRKVRAGKGRFVGGQDFLGMNWKELDIEGFWGPCWRGNFGIFRGL